MPVTRHGSGAVQLWLPEQPAASTSCLRWRERRSRYRVAARGFVDPHRYEVGPLGHAQAADFVRRHHYSGTMPAARLCVGLWDRALATPGDAAALVGTAVFSVPTHPAVLTGIFPALAPYEASLDCGRFVLLDDVPGNAETWFLARAFREIAEQGVRGVVSFADPLPRHDLRDGHLVMPGHRGVIYMASGAIYTGRTRRRRIWLLPDGTTLPERDLSKVRAGERGREYVLARLCALGAPPIRPDQDAGLWLSAALAAAGARRVQHPGCHRYAFRLGRTRREREAVLIAPPAHPYPRAA